MNHSDNPDLTVALCTRNPRRDYLDRVLSALREQTLSVERWELLLVDNASAVSLRETVDLGWHPRARHIFEARVGFYPAKHRAIREAVGEIMVYVDDDNVLDPNYLQTALGLFGSNPRFGCVSGTQRPEYEIQPPAWFRGEYESWIAVRSIKRDLFSNFWHPMSEPCGAGMVVRRNLILPIAIRSENNNQSLFERRLGVRPAAGEDVEFSHAALDAGFFVGQTPSLRLTHLIGASRLDERYLFGLYRNNIATGSWLSARRAKGRVISMSFREALKELTKLLFKDRIGRRLAWERLMAFLIARRAHRAWLKAP